MSESAPIQKSLDSSALGRRPDDATDPSNLVGLVAASGDLQLAHAFLGNHPEQRDSLDAALMGNRNYGLIHQIAATTPPGVAAAVPASQPATIAPVATPARLLAESHVKSFQTTNAAAMAADQKQMTQLAGLQLKLSTRLQTDLVQPSRQKAAQIGTTIQGANTYLAKDLQLRQDAAQAIAKSTSPKGELGKDPAVAGALAALDAHARTRHPATTADALKSIGHRIDSLKRADVPEWVSTRAGSAGPRYPDNPERKIGTSPAWSSLVNSGAATASEQRVISRMADNEGSLDAVQAYDNQIASLGAMQKTIDPNGNGELAKQVYEFSQSNPTRYKTLFSDQGWTATHTGTGSGNGDYSITYQKPNDPTAQPLSGRALNDYIRHPHDPARWEQTLGPLFRAGRDADFQQKQIGDFVNRLDSALAKVPSGSYTQPISSFVSSEQAGALVLDQDVNRPGYVADDMGRALDTFFAANPGANRDPAQWTAAQRPVYEQQIVNDYTQVRRMTDAALRANHVVGPGTTLSALPGSLLRPTVP
ncbi:MAG: hypothetical protein ABI843_03945 [Dokdonella sp.]